MARPSRHRVCAMVALLSCASAGCHTLQKHLGIGTGSTPTTASADSASKPKHLRHGGGKEPKGLLEGGDRVHRDSPSTSDPFHAPHAGIRFHWNDEGAPRSRPRTRTHL